MDNQLDIMPGCDRQHDIPRAARFDAPDILHPVMIRKIERRNISRNNIDGEDFIDRLEAFGYKIQKNGYSWGVHVQHAHTLFRTGTEPLSRLMRRLVTGRW